MNLMGGGTGGFISEEQQRYRSQCGGKAYAKRLENDLEFREKHNKIVSKNLKKHIESGKHNFKTFEGKQHSDKSKKLISETKKGKNTGKNSSQYDTCWITKDKLDKKIKKSEINKWLKKGWIKGRKNIKE